jgi:hypothetical protein
MAPGKLFAWVTVSGALLACSGGSGPPVTTSNQGRDNPGTTRDAPPNARDSTSSQGGSGGSSNCIECDVSYTCTGSPGFQGISLSSGQGTCTAAIINSICSGGLFGTGPCSGGGGGAFTCGNVTCSPEVQVGTPGTSSGGAQGGGANGSSGGVGG